MSDKEDDKPFNPYDAYNKSKNDEEKQQEGGGDADDDGAIEVTDKKWYSFGGAFSGSSGRSGNSSSGGSNSNSRRRSLTEKEKLVRKMIAAAIGVIVFLTGIILLAKSLKKVPETEIGLKYKYHRKKLDDAAKSGGLFRYVVRW